MLKQILVFGVALCAVLTIALASTEEEAAALDKRKGKLFPIFQIVTFPNTGCTGSASKNGTCYTAAECTAKGGVSSGTCAQSYGVCCVFTIHCGQTSSQNCTYFESSGIESGACTAKICKCSSNICQMRIDFNQFVISGPSTSTVSIGKVVNGVPSQTAGGKSVTPQTQCLTDTFTVTNPGGQSPSAICGINTGQHMYIPASDSCNTLAFQLGQAGVGTALAQRQWSIKVTQYDCNYQNLAPPGCTQYFYGSTTGSVQSYNYAGGKQLANQDQNICVRQERGDCKICWTTQALTDFEISATSATIMKQSMCCGYGSKGSSTKGGDCVTIPGALTTKMTKTSKRGYDRICGSMMGLVGGTSKGKTAKAKTICSTNTPFNLRFMSDGYEFVTSEAMKVQKGFALTYFMSGTGCTAATG